MGHDSTGTGSDTEINCTITRRQLQAVFIAII